MLGEFFGDGEFIFCGDDPVCCSYSCFNDFLDSIFGGFEVFLLGWRWDLLQIRSVAFPWRMPVGVFVCGFLLIVPFFGLGVFCVMLAFLRALVFVVHVRPSWW